MKILNILFIFILTCNYGIKTATSKKYYKNILKNSLNITTHEDNSVVGDLINASLSETKKLNDAACRDGQLCTRLQIKNKCGIRNENGLLEKLPINKPEDSAEYGEFPWMIAVLKIERDPNESYEVFKCGGSLIHPNVVLTAAHCVYKYNSADLIIRAGQWDLTTNDELLQFQNRKVNEKIIHEKFSRSGVFNDIALLLTSEPFELSQHINTICLPPSNINFNHNSCFSNGWGKDQYGPNGRYHAILKKIQFTVIPSSACEAKLKEDKHIRSNFKLHESFICGISEPGKDLCKGDGGGPLNCPIPDLEQKGRYYLAGILSWGNGCTGEYPNVFAHISYLRDWVDNIVRMKNFDPSYYIA